LRGLDGLVVAVKHSAFEALLPGALAGMMRRPSVVMDVKWMLGAGQMPAGVTYASL